MGCNADIFTILNKFFIHTLASKFDYHLLLNMLRGYRNLHAHVNSCKYIKVLFVIERSMT